MISNDAELTSALRQLLRFSEMLTVLGHDASQSNDWSLFPTVSKGYFHKTREIDGEIREYLKLHPDAAVAGRVHGAKPA